MSTLFSGATHKALSAGRGLIKIWDVENEYNKEKVWIVECTSIEYVVFVLVFRD